MRGRRGRKAMRRGSGVGGSGFEWGARVPCSGNQARRTGSDDGGQRRSGAFCLGARRIGPRNLGAPGVAVGDEQEGFRIGRPPVQFLIVLNQRDAPEDAVLDVGVPGRIVFQGEGRVLIERIEKEKIGIRIPGQPDMRFGDVREQAPARCTRPSRAGTGGKVLRETAPIAPEDEQDSEG